MFFRKRRVQEEYIDPRRSRILGFDHYFLDTILYSMILGIAHGDDLPPVPVTYKNGAFRLTNVPDTSTLRNSPFLDGGHHRSMARRITGTPLKVLILPDKFANPESRYELSQMTIIEDDEGNYDIQRSAGKNYRPIDGMQRPIDDWYALAESILNMNGMARINSE